MTSEGPHRPGQEPDEAPPGGGGPAPYGDRPTQQDNGYGASAPDLGWLRHHPPARTRPHQRGRTSRATRGAAPRRPVRRKPCPATGTSPPAASSPGHPRETSRSSRPRVGRRPVRPHRRGQPGRTATRPRPPGPPSPPLRTPRSRQSGRRTSRPPASPTAPTVNHRQANRTGPPASRAGPAVRPARASPTRQRPAAGAVSSPTGPACPAATIRPRLVLDVLEPVRRAAPVPYRRRPKRHARHPAVGARRGVGSAGRGARRTPNQHRARSGSVRRSGLSAGTRTGHLPGQHGAVAAAGAASAGCQPGRHAARGLRAAPAVQRRPRPAVLSRQAPPCRPVHVGSCPRPTTRFARPVRPRHNHRVYGAGPHRAHRGAGTGARRAAAGAPLRPGSGSVRRGPGRGARPVRPLRRRRLHSVLRRRAASQPAGVRCAGNDPFGGRPSARVAPTAPPSGPSRAASTIRRTLRRRSPHRRGARVRAADRARRSRAASTPSSRSPNRLRKPRHRRYATDGYSPRYWSPPCSSWPFRSAC